MRLLREHQQNDIIRELSEVHDGLIIKKQSGISVMLFVISSLVSLEDSCPFSQRLLFIQVPCKKNFELIPNTLF